MTAAEYRYLQAIEQIKREKGKVMVSGKQVLISGEKFFPSPLTWACRRGMMGLWKVCRAAPGERRNHYEKIRADHPGQGLPHQPGR